MAMGTHFCADRLGLPGHQPLCGMVRVPPVSGLQHAPRSQGDHGVRTSFTDFLQGKGKRWGKSSQRDFADPKGAVPNECNNSEEMQDPYKGQAMRLFFPSKTIGKPGVGKGNGVQGKTNIERLGKGSNDSILGRIKLSPWGPGHGGIAATTAIPMGGKIQAAPRGKGGKGAIERHHGRCRHSLGKSPPGTWILCKSLGGGLMQNQAAGSSAGAQQGLLGKEHTGGEDVKKGGGDHLG